MISHPHDLHNKLNIGKKTTKLEKKYDHATPLLFSLHWLPVECRIHYKIACIVFKSINGDAPTYLSNHIAIYTPERNLRSSNDKKKLVKRTHKTKFGEWSFQCFGPRVWNDLPCDLRECNSIESFKKNLKTYFFELYFISNKWIFYPHVLVLHICDN